ncbi:hypothetical protein V5O48_017703 [Marasmius crinis-equi]|uniref:Hypervirulence associated protein TUDOR domain-containing protein n=1 Tax=Marasmius crinis-equi TaxID=585013 RepID=A0ABR3EN86_9AGAR
MATYPGKTDGAWVTASDDTDENGAWVTVNDTSDEDVNYREGSVVDMREENVVDTKEESVADSKGNGSDTHDRVKQTGDIRDRNWRGPVP